MGVVLYTAVTIDGYIARKNNSLDWLYGLENPNQIDHGYFEFLSGVDTIVMGRKTYEEILGFNIPWPYEAQKTYVVSTQETYKVSTPNTKLLGKLDTETVENLRGESKKNIWIVGGGELVTSLLNLGAVDTMILTLIPILLGEGIPLFPNSPKETQFTLVESTPFETGAVNLTYQRK